MTIVPEGWRRWRAIWRRPAVAEIDAELQFHFDERVEELVGRGIDTDAARAQAVAEFGNVNSVRRDLVTIDVRVARKRGFTERWEWLGQDLGYVLRSLRRSPGFVVMVAGILALGIGANAAVFSLLDRLFVQSPPGVVHPGQIRRLYRFYQSAGKKAHEEGDFSLFVYPEIEDIAKSVAPIPIGGYMSEQGLTVGMADERKTGIVTFVAGQYFGILGARAIVGRLFSADELRIDMPHPVLVISQALWHDRYANRGDIVGMSLDVNDHRYTIIGVAGSDFHGADNNASDLWLPISEMRWIGGKSDVWYQGNFWMEVLTTVRGAADVTTLEHQATQVFRHDGVSHDSGVVAHIDPLVAATAPGEDDKPAKVAVRLAGVALLILLIAISNVANIFLVRGLRRRREIAIRLALGVTRRRLVALLLVESLIVALLGGLAALAVSYPSAALLRAALLPQTHWADSPLNLHVILLTLVFALVAGATAGLLPALRASRPDLINTLKNGAGTWTPHGTRIRTTLLIAQTALSVVLVVGAGLFVRSLQRIATENVGYDTDRVVFVQIRQPGQHFERRPEIRRRLLELADRLRVFPGVERIGLATNAPFRGSWGAMLYLPNRDSVVTSVSRVSPEYLGTVGVRLLRGRGFAANDRSGPGSPVLVNEALARKLWPNQNAIGRCVIQRDAAQPCSEVVGIVQDAREMRIEETAQPRFYAPMLAEKDAEVIALRTDPRVAARIASQVQQMLDKEFGTWALPEVWLMSESKNRELQPWRAGAMLFSVAGLLALLVTLVGVYSTISYVFGQRTRELGIRMALGAHSGQIARLVLSDGVGVVGIGAGFGIVIALAAGRLVESLLYHTSAYDPLVLVATVAAVLFMAAAASLGPAWRAIRIDPAAALRSE